MSRGILFGLMTIMAGIIVLQRSENEMLRETNDERIHLTSSITNTPIVAAYYQIPEKKLTRVEIDEKTLTAISALVIVDNNDSPRLALRATQRHPIASLTKLMTAIIAEEYIGNEKTVEITEEDIATEGPAGELQPGELFSVYDLITAMMVVSSNDAAQAIANHYGMRAFTDLMQQKAKEIGMTDTAFIDPTGLSSLNQSTVTDLRLLIDYVRKHHPEIFELSRRKETNIIDQKAGSKKLLKNINEFAGEKEFRGGKTGYTPEARGNLISLFAPNDHQVTTIVLGADDRFAETRKLYQWIKNNLKVNE